MVKAICIVLAVIILIGIIGSIGFMVFKVSDYMINQNFNFRMAWDWSLNDLNDIITNMNNMFGAAAENYQEYRYSVNEYIDVVGCTSL